LAPDVSMPLADILRLEVQRFDAGRTIRWVGGAIMGGFILLIWDGSFDLRRL